MVDGELAHGGSSEEARAPEAAALRCSSRTLESTPLPRHPRRPKAERTCTTKRQQVLYGGP